MRTKVGSDEFRAKVSAAKRAENARRRAAGLPVPSFTRAALEMAWARTRGLRADPAWLAEFSAACTHGQLERGRRQRAAGGPWRDGWSREEDQLLLDNPHRTARDLAAKLGRTKRAVKDRRRVLRARLGATAESERSGGAE